MMAVLIALAAEKAGANSDTAFSSGKEILETNLKRWSIPYKLLTGVNGDPVIKPMVIRHSYAELGERVAVIPYGNGFVTSLIRAYHQGLHLCLRPEDVWLSILSQLRVYAYRHPDSIPGLSSSTNLNADLSIDLDINLDAVDSTYLEQKICGLSEALVNDAELRDWILPKFSTTTTTDRAVASIVMMGELRKSTEPDYDLRSQAGLSSIKLGGEKSDWEKILRKVEERVPYFGQEAFEWCKFLTPVIKGMISSFDSPHLPQSKEFWGQACHFEGVNLGSDLETLTGWITAFCFWADAGYCLHSDLIDAKTLQYHRNPAGEPSHEHETVICSDGDGDKWAITKFNRKKIFIGDVKCHHILPRDISNGTAMALTYVRDYSHRMIYSATMIAGSMGAIPTKVGYLRDETVLKPWSGWFLLEDESNVMPPLEQHKVSLDEEGHEVIELD